MENKVTLKFFFLIINIFSSHCGPYSHEQESSGKVVGISDGDTFTLLTPDKQQLKVRLSEIDAPEKARPFGPHSRQALSDLFFSKGVLVVQDDIDRYGRAVGQIYVN